MIDQKKSNPKAECPPECNLKVKNNKERLDKIDKIIETKAKELWEKRDEDYKHWEAEMSERPRTRTLVWVFGPILTLLLFFIAFSFNSIKEGQTDAIKSLKTHQAEALAAVKESQKEIKESLKVVTDRVTDMRLELLEKR
ncbi:MAG: hypothetical protein ACW987_18725 [Candidatus Thorarchaeota archaeon]